MTEFEKLITKTLNNQTMAEDRNFVLAMEEKISTHERHRLVGIILAAIMAIALLSGIFIGLSFIGENLI